MVSASIPAMHGWGNLYYVSLPGALGLSPRHGGGLMALFLFGRRVAGMADSTLQRACTFPVFLSLVMRNFSPQIRFRVRPQRKVHRRRSTTLSVTRSDQTNGSRTAVRHESTWKNWIDVPPVFIVGHGRSGTTLLRMMLTAHPNLFISSEEAYVCPLRCTISSCGDLRDIKNLDKFRIDLLPSADIRSAKARLPRAAQERGRSRTRGVALSRAPPRACLEASQKRDES
jgi:hypothetical protein